MQVGVQKKYIFFTHAGIRNEEAENMRCFSGPRPWGLVAVMNGILLWSVCKKLRRIAAVCVTGGAAGHSGERSFF